MNNNSAEQQGQVIRLAFLLLLVGVLFALATIVQRQSAIAQKQETLNREEINVSLKGDVKSITRDSITVSYSLKDIEAALAKDSVVSVY